MSLEFICLVVHVLDFSMAVFTTHDGRRIDTRLLLLAIVLLILFVDYIYRMFVDAYTTGCNRTPDHPMYNAPDCSTLLLPVTAPLRVLPLLLRHKGLGNSIHSFFVTLGLASDVMTLLVTFVVLSSSMGMALFFNITEDDNAFANMIVMP